MLTFILFSAASVTDGSHKSKAEIVVGVIGGAVGVVKCCIIICFLWRGRNRGYKREVFVDVAGSFSCLFELNGWLCFLELYCYLKLMVLWNLQVKMSGELNLVS